MRLPKDGCWWEFGASAVIGYNVLFSADVPNRNARALIRTASSNPACALAKAHTKFSTSQTTEHKIKLEEKVILNAKNTIT